MKDLQKYWFPAKKYGWGWGFPTTWQGWLVLLAYIATLAIFSLIFEPQELTFLFILA